MAVLVASVVLVMWLPDLHLPLGDSDDGRILARFGLQARNFWDQGARESGFGALIDPYIRAEYGIVPGEQPPREAVTYAHHPPLQTFLSILSVGLFGDSPAGLRVIGFLVGSATVLFMTSLLRVRGLPWGPTLLAVGAMTVTGFYYVYGRIGVGFSLIVASAAAVAYLRDARNPPVAVQAGVALLACLCAMQSWIAMAAIALLLIWLFTGKGWVPVTRWVTFGAVTGVLVTAAWLLNATDTIELGNRVAFRVDTSRGTFGEFLARQWRFAGRFTPVWFQALAPFALAAGLVDRRTRVPVAVTLGVAAAWTFGLQQGAWIHLLWNFPWLAPVTIGMAALIDAGRRVTESRMAGTVAIGAVVVLAATLYGVATGPTRDNYLTHPADAGKLMERLAVSPPSGHVWVTPGIGTPRWVSYYLDAPVWTLRSETQHHLDTEDFVLVRTDRVPDEFPEDWQEAPVLVEGRYRLIRAEELLR